MPDFEDVLSIPVEDIEAPKPRPIGTYLAQLQGLPKLRDFTGKSDGTEYKTVDFSLRIMSAGPDVNQEELEEQPPINEWRPMTYTVFYNTPEGADALKEFVLITCAVEPEPGQNLKQLLPETAGRTINVQLKVESYTDNNSKQKFRSRIGSVAPA